GGDWRVAAAAPHRWLEIGLLIGGGTLAMTGAALLIAAEVEDNALSDDCAAFDSCTIDTRNDRASRITSMGTAGVVLLGLGGTVMITAGVLWLVDTTDTASTAIAPTLQLDASGVQGGVRWRF